MTESLWKEEHYERGVVGGSRHFQFLHDAARDNDRLPDLYRVVMANDDLLTMASAHAIPDDDAYEAFREGHVDGFVGTANEWALAYYHEMDEI